MVGFHGSQRNADPKPDVLLALFVIGQTAFIQRLIGRREPSVVSSLSRWITVIAGLIYAITLFSQVTNALGYLGGPRFGLYLIGLLLLLFGAGVNFVRLVWVGSSRFGPSDA